MVLVTPNFALLVFGIILIAAAFVAWKSGAYINYDRGSFHVFIAVLTGLGVFVTFMFYYNLVQLQEQQQDLAAVQELSRISNNVINTVLDEITAASTIIPNFVLSITPLSNTVCCDTGGTGSTGGTGTCNIPVATDPINPETCTRKFVLSYHIFGLWQDVIMSNKFIAFDSTAYVSNFLQRANSSQLYTQWTVAHIDFNKSTQQFGDLLFEYGLPITVQTADNYEAMAEQLIADPRFQAIIK
jgi:hypothetical protein